MICICITPLNLFFPLLPIFCGGASSCNYSLFCPKLLAIQLSVFRSNPHGIFLLFCWLGKKKLILVSVLIAIWRPKKTLKIIQKWRNKESIKSLNLASIHSMLIGQAGIIDLLLRQIDTSFHCSYLCISSNTVLKSSISNSGELVIIFSPFQTQVYEQVLLVGQTESWEALFVGGWRVSAAVPEGGFGTAGVNQLRFMFLRNPALQPIPCYLLFLFLFSHFLNF